MGLPVGGSTTKARAVAVLIATGIGVAGDVPTGGGTVATGVGTVQELLS